MRWEPTHPHPASLKYGGRNIDDYQRWWGHETEGNHVSARAWANAGWRIESLDVNAKWVKLARVG